MSFIFQSVHCLKFPCFLNSHFRKKNESHLYQHPPRGGVRTLYTILYQHPPRGNPKGLFSGTPYHPFGTPWRVQVGKFDRNATANGGYFRKDFPLYQLRELPGGPRQSSCPPALKDLWIKRLDCMTTYLEDHPS